MHRDLPPPDEKESSIRVQYGNRCQGCAKTDGEVDQLHVWPIVPREAAANQLSNYTLLCTTCREAAERVP